MGNFQEQKGSGAFDNQVFFLFRAACLKAWDLYSVPPQPVECYTI